MLARYTIYRRRPAGAPALPDAIRKDTRHRTSHILRPTKEIVEAYLADPTDDAWEVFRVAYLELLAERYAHDKQAFDDLATLATTHDVFIGCSCPTKSNPDVRRCHTYLALGFMERKYPSLPVKFPDATD